MAKFSKKRYQELREKAIDASRLVLLRKRELITAQNAYVKSMSIYHDLCNDLFGMVGEDVGLKPLKGEINAKA
jgi:hypothetical protein